MSDDIRPVRERVPWTSVAAPLIRETLRRANAAKLSQGEYKVVNAVVTLTGTYSKLRDKVTLTNLCRETGLSKRQVQRILSGYTRAGWWFPGLAERGLLFYKPGSNTAGGRGRTNDLITVGLISSETETPQASDFPTDTATQLVSAFPTAAPRAACEETETPTAGKPRHAGDKNNDTLGGVIPRRGDQEGEIPIAFSYEKSALASRNDARAHSSTDGSDWRDDWWRDEVLRAAVDGR